MSAEPSSRPTSFLSRNGVLAIVVAAVVAIDQLTKALVAKHLVLGQSVPIVSGLLDFTLVRNTGMAFGVFSRSDWPYKSVLVTILAVGAMAAVTYYAFKTPVSERWTRFGLALILGGAVGNIVDRARLGYVIDFVDVFYRDMHWPAFNVADSCISVGVGLLVLETIRHREPEVSTSRQEPITHGGEG